MINYGSVCSGIECATLAWHDLGWKPQFFAEVEKEPSAVLKFHYPDVPNVGDMRNVEREHGPINLLVGGTPCQSFSIAGKRAGLDDPRGNLALEFVRVLDRLHPEWFVWENVPGIFSSWSDVEDVQDGGSGERQGGEEFVESSDFACLLGAFTELGYCCAWRVLDAQYFGIPQQRKRVFVVGHIGDWRYPTAVLFEPTCLSGDFKAGRKTGEEIAGTIGCGSEKCGRGYKADLDTSGAFIPEKSRCLRGQAQSSHRADSETYIPEKVGAVSSKWAKGTGGPAGDEAYNLVSVNARQDPIVSGKAQPLDTDGHSQAISFDVSKDGGGHTEKSPTLRSQNPDKSHTAGGGHVGVLGIRLANTSSNGIGIQNEKSHTLDGSPDAIAFTQNTRDEVRLISGDGRKAGALGANEGMKQKTYINTVHPRRLMPIECERLQGVPDNYTLVPYNGKMMSDSARYRMIGNGMAIPVMEWIGTRIQRLIDILKGITTENTE